MKTKILLLFAWLMLAVTGCSANEPQTSLPDTPPAEKPEESVEPSGDRKVLIVYFFPYGQYPNDCRIYSRYCEKRPCRDQNNGYLYGRLRHVVGTDTGGGRFRLLSTPDDPDRGYIFV